MNKEEIRSAIRNAGIVPVVRAASGEQAIRAVDAILAGGLPVIELTMTVPGAIDVIAELRKRFGSEILLGAGTVLDANTAARCLNAGAEFIVSPGFDADTVRFVKSKQVLMAAGALTPTEVIHAWRAGSDIVKIFPCGNVGGPSYIKALKGPLPQVPMIPTGGVNLKTAGDFLKAGAEALGVGGELVSAAALASGQTESITAAVREYLAIVRDVRGEVAARA